MKCLTAGHRVYLRKNLVSAPMVYGVYYPLMRSGFTAAAGPSHLLRGFVIPVSQELDSVELWVNATKNHVDAAWRTWIICQKRTSGTKTVSNVVWKSDIHVPQSTAPFLHTYDVRDSEGDKWTVERGDLLSFAFERTTTGGSSSYYLNTELTFSLRTP